MCFFFNDTTTTEIYTLSLHDALPISRRVAGRRPRRRRRDAGTAVAALRGHRDDREPLPAALPDGRARARARPRRSEEHTSELQSRQYIVCRLLLEKKKYIPPTALDSI